MLVCVTDNKKWMLGEIIYIYIIVSNEKCPLRSFMSYIQENRRLWNRITDKGLNVLLAYVNNCFYFHFQ